MEDKIFRQDAKTIVDLAFNEKLFNDKLTRDDFNAFEDMLCFLMQSRFEGYQRMQSLMNKLDSTS